MTDDLLIRLFLQKNIKEKMDLSVILLIYIKLERRTIMSHLLLLFQKLGITTPSFRDCIEILLIIALVYYCLKYIRGTRMWIVAKGIAIFFVCYGMTVVFELPVIQYLFQIAVSFMTIALVVVF